jgi:hypothetical protein
MLIVHKEGEPLFFDNLLPHQETKVTIVEPLGNESLLIDDVMAHHIEYVLDLTLRKCGSIMAAVIVFISFSGARR